MTETQISTIRTRTAAPGTTTTPGRTHTSAGPALSPLGLFTVLLGAALPLIDFFIVNVALPTMDHDLHAGPAVLELVVAGYGVAYAVLLVLGGRLGDTFGRRRLFLAGMAAFGLTSLACGLAPDAWSLVGARVAQGASAALMLPQVLATIHSSTSGSRRARALSMYGATAGLSMVAGQILGGVLVAADIAGTGWRAVFLVNVPVALIGLVLAVRTVPETRSKRPAPVDVPGTVLLALSLITLMVPLTEGRAAGWPLWTWLGLGAFPFVAAAFYVVERRADRAGKTPLLPPSLFALPGLRRGLAMVVPFSIGFGGFMFVIAVALQQGLRYGPVEAGLALAPMATTFFVASLMGPRLVGRYGSRVVTAGGLIQAVGITLLMLAVWRDWPDLSLAGLLPGVALAGFGQGLQLPVLIRIVLADVPNERAGVGSGVMVTTQQSALALGVATLGTLFLSLGPSAGMGDALVITLAAQLGAIALTVLMSLRLPRKVS
ncbi:MFS transporter [Streptomyces rapamycinicus]|uniref:Major facilitator superfamily MFS_1 n=2 Tax=Streptomyces rapamycinicus TaxID=1226757 RepID=A0A0A0NLC5_STRRN|nr:MFS transporter [Streptomyces rapamycinicus]AGP57981.1 MFS transporter [Streptomyces rapamycinicus NRRL 5491]MBB4785652.1 MFS family permease [Streptomyces rapamycinicus]RLV78883.1 major facilitator superfamily MFS_1 [Streptomyces rapamycinicus NRRL 5491]UTO65819.1 MFS transporter [Streptomyces rapamycinicus]UTP33774.1 MFS transporter [Streptomyces rapamycinicus NRRL 5491]